jgi:SAM-dependent methyltransferase
MLNNDKLNLGSGNEILEGYINHDIFSLPGIDSVHDLNVFPWPWADGSMAEVRALNVLEHLDNFMLAIEEIYRILKPSGKCYISVPYWNSWCAAADPTHKRGFHEITFSFFDPESDYGRERAYYSKAKFSIEDERFILAPFGPYYGIPGVGRVEVRMPALKRFVGFLGNYVVGNLIHDLRLTLVKRI